MSPSPASPAQAAPKGGHTAFFRQSGWMVFATVGSGVFMFGVHFFSKKIPEAEYSILGTLLAILNCMTIPSLPLQMIFAQQTAAAVTDEQHRQLAGTTRTVLLGVFALWLLAAAGIWIGRDHIIGGLQLSNPAALWVTLLIGLAALCLPVFSGVLQGQQNFLWLGTSSILAGAGRFVAVTVIVLVFFGHATGIMIGALIGVLASLAVAAWHSRAAWQYPAAAIAWRPWLRRVVPLTLGFGACQFLFSADPIFVQNYFGKDQAYPYMAAGTLSRALIQFTGPLAWVMFPKVVRSMARKEKTNVLALTLATTGVLAVLGAIGLSVVAPWVLRLVFKESFLPAVELLPWFAFSMVPLTMANVLVNNLLARERFAVVPWLLLLALGYGITLTQFHDSFLTVIQVLGTFNLLLMAVAGFFTWRTRDVFPAAR